MKNFFYVLTYNITNLVIQRALDGSPVSVLDNAIEFKTRSKLYKSYSETAQHVHDDFERKLVKMQLGENFMVKILSVMNPSIIGSSVEEMASLVERFGHRSIDAWDDECCGVVFFMRVPDDSNESDLDGITPNAWMLKYEIFFSEDNIELTKNGDFALMSLQNFTSTYH